MAFSNFDKKLTWSDFVPVEQAPVDNGEAATIGVTWDVGHEPGRNGNTIIVASVNVSVLMPDKNLCKVVKTKMTDYILKHEQGHYDIIALGAREFYKKVQKLTAESDILLTEKIDKLFDEIKAKADLVDARYDTATNHSIDKDVQAAWNTKIEATKKLPNGTVDDLP